jgi:hypothetical protein
MIKLAINSSALCDQAPNTNTLEIIIDAIIASCTFAFSINHVAILSFAEAIKTRALQNLYLLYASNPHTNSLPTISTFHCQLQILQGFLHSHLDGPRHFHNIPNIPPVATHFKVLIPFTNNMDKSLQFFIEGFSVTLLLGDRQVENILTLCHLDYLIFNAVNSLHSTFPPMTPSLTNLTSSRHVCHWFSHFKKKGLILHLTSTTTTMLTRHPTTPGPPTTSHFRHRYHKTFTLL